MLAGSPAQRPQGVLDAFCQGDETLAAEHDMGMLEAGIGEPEMIEPVVQGLASDRNAGMPHVGEIRQAHPPRHLHLPENDLLLFAMDGPPRADTPLQGPANAASQFRMAADHLLENGDRSKAGGCLQHRHDFGIENISERIGPSASSRSLLRGQLRILLDAIRRGNTD